MARCTSILRNDDLDAREFIDPATIPEYRQNQFGGSIGGPIKKDKMFFFANYEGIRLVQGETRIGSRSGLQSDPGQLRDHGHQPGHRSGDSQYPGRFSQRDPRVQRPTGGLGNSHPQCPRELRSRTV